MREVVAVDSDASMVEVARANAPANVRVELGDGEQLPFDDGEFDVAATLRTLHHTLHPDRLVAELVRVTKPGGIVLVVDQLAPVDAEEARALNEFERARDASTSRVLSERDLRELFAQLGLTVVRAEVDREPRDLDAYLDLAGCAGAERDRVARARTARVRGDARLVRPTSTVSVTTAPGASACTHAAGRYQRGT